ncbi:hypothetical protein K2X05_11770 [bacterium]|nr:hypothetical protein [bacterium]
MMSSKKILVIGCSLTLHHSTTGEPISGVRERTGDYSFRLAELFPNATWYNFGKGASSNFEYVRRISNFIKQVGRPDFILVQMTYAERTLLEFHNYKEIKLDIQQVERSNYNIVVEKNIKENAAYISGYNLYCTFLPQKMISVLKDVFALHLTSTFHAWRFWETYFFIQTYLKKINMPHLLFITHHPTKYPEPPIDYLPLDFSTTIHEGKTSLYQWFDKNLGPYENFVISDDDHHLKMEYNKIFADQFLAPAIKDYF